MSRAKALSLVVLVIASVVGGGCSAVSPGPALARSDVPRASADPGAAPAAGAAVDAFGLDAFRAIRGQSGDRNLVFSPSSIAIALAMARAGARGDTAAQMDAVLRSLGADEHAAALSALDQALNSRSGSFPAGDGKNYDLTLTVANALYGQRDYSWKQPFLDSLAQRLDAGVRLVDYRTDPDAARREINGWVSDQTHQRIPELLDQGVLGQLTRLVLVNAIYLKAPWQNPFLESATQPGDFTRADGSTAQAPMMTLNESLPYAKGVGWQAVELPYVGDSLAMMIIVPDDLKVFLASLDGDALAAVTSSLSPTQVNLTMPRFSIQTKADLEGLLSSLGMPLAFSASDADFSGMTDEERLYIARVIHQANIDVDEKGTEAAAATAIVMRAMGLPAQPVEMRVDRPFIFAVRDVPTGAVLFLGQVVDPSAK